MEEDLLVFCNMSDALEHEFAVNTRLWEHDMLENMWKRVERRILSSLRTSLKQ
jgi:hypothetical protein